MLRSSCATVRDAVCVAVHDALRAAVCCATWSLQSVSRSTCTAVFDAVRFVVCVHYQKHPLKWVKTGCAVGEFVYVM